MKRINPTQRVTYHCPCGRLSTAVISHYDIVRCGQCGKSWWALQPKRDGPLVAFPWRDIHPAIAA